MSFFRDHRKHPNSWLGANMKDEAYERLTNQDLVLSIPAEEEEGSPSLDITTMGAHLILSTFVVQ